MAPLIILAGLAGSLPYYDIDKACRREMAVAEDASGVGGCAEEETASRNRLAREWPDYSAPARRERISDPIDGTARSYVEIETCFEVLYWKRHPDADRGYHVHAAR
jgi:hypothetical protein